jgi:hypothetical protein
MITYLLSNPAFVEPKNGCHIVELDWWDSLIGSQFSISRIRIS